MINDDEHDQHDEHDDDYNDDDVMHDMHTNTMHHAWCQHMPQRQHATHKRTKTHKNKRNVTKTCKNIQRHESNNGVQKNHGNKTRRTQGGPQDSKGSLKHGTHVTKQDEGWTKRDAHHTIYVMGATPPPPSGHEHPEGLPIPPCLWKTLWITPVTQTTV
jgi:hypothetical protein